MNLHTALGVQRTYHTVAQSSPSGLGQAQTGAWNRWPRLFLTNEVYSPPAMYTATTLMITGHWNWSGREKTTVVVYDNTSNRFWNAASTVEKAPRWPTSTS